LDAFPNPFNPSTMIHYWLPSDAYVELEVFNGLGELVACLAKGAEQAGPHRVQFDGTKLASGTYYCRFQVLGKLQTKKVVLLK
jgi:pantoate kinase